MIVAKKATATKVPADPAMLIEAAERMVNAVAHCKAICEQEKTKRADISARKEVEIERIKAQRSALELAINNTFKERRVNFDRLFDALDQGIAKGDLDVMNIAMGGIIAQIQSPAMKEVGQIMASINSPNAGHIEF